jgi:hypothetical protein
MGDAAALLLALLLLLMVLVLLLPAKLNMAGAMSPGQLVDT